MRTHEAALIKGKDPSGVTRRAFPYSRAGEICGEIQLAIDEDPIS